MQQLNAANPLTRYLEVSGQYSSAAKHSTAPVTNPGVKRRALTIIYIGGLLLTRVLTLAAFKFTLRLRGRSDTLAERHDTLAERRHGPAECCAQVADRPPLTKVPRPDQASARAQPFLSCYQLAYLKV